ncbi:DUF3206 domain-containing protein [Enterococcus casseliflavus]|uniref:DUF3206 domain-containing protein n=1 Tax=Enterococcus casseliflavus TaxID=37734 RepID=UPI0022E7ACAA|nr:DUF3206 domain-containing protein [Enterococcus casseliflavus]MEB6085070.1 DUF3206 domain-containing protein [Enterococcus casseliflavus]
MLNIMTSDREPRFEYEGVTRKFVENTMAFSYGYFEKDTSKLDPLILQEIEKEPNWLKRAVTEAQSVIISSLVGNENFKNREEIEHQLLVMTGLYVGAYKESLNEEQEDLVVMLLDRFVLALLTSERFIEFLAQLPQA